MTSRVKWLTDPPPLPDPSKWQGKSSTDILLRLPECIIPFSPYYKVNRSDETTTGITEDGTTYLARSAIYVRGPFAVPLQKGVTANAFCAFGVVASSASDPVDITLDGMLRAGLGEDIDETVDPDRTTEKDSSRKICINRNTCLWESTGTVFDSFVGDRVYVFGSHRMESDSVSTTVQTTGGATVAGNTVVPIDPPGSN